MNTYLRKISNPIALGYLSFCILLVFSCIFYLERTCYADVALQCFWIINHQNVFPQLDRFGSALIHLFPLSALLLHLPLKYVLLSYSAAFILENIFFYWLLERILKQKEIALILALFNVLMVTETFYWTTSEIKQGLSLCILFSGIARTMPVSRFSGAAKAGLLVFYFAMLVTTLLLHNLVVFAVVFIMGYGLLAEWKIEKKTVMWCLGMMTLILFVKYALFPLNWYEAGKYGLRQNFITYFPDYFSLPGFRQFFFYCFNDWYWFALFFLAVAVYYVVKKMWWRLSWVLIFTVDYLVLVNVSHPEGARKDYAESFYQALAVFVLYPFVLELFPKLKTSHGLLLLVMVFSLRLNKIYHGHQPYRERLEIIRETLAEHNGKFAVLENYFDVGKLKMSWGAAYESALLTSLVSADSCRSFVILQDTSQYVNEEEYNDYREYFYTVFKPVDYEKLNRHYFRPAPGEYRLISRDEFFHRIQLQSERAETKKP